MNCVNIRMHGATIKKKKNLFDICATARLASAVNNKGQRGHVKLQIVECLWRNVLQIEDELFRNDW